MASNKTKFFRVAVEGATVDGREIKRDWLTQMARHYNPAVYGARVNVEHIKGYAPMSGNAPFGAYGDVLALQATEIEDGPLKGKLALYAQIDPTDELVALSKKRQKLYTSIEINPAFADIGEAYLVGLAATDDPASLGTEVLRFAAKRSTNLFSAACETAIEFEREDRSQDDVRGTDDAQSLLTIVRALFARHPSSADQRYADMRRAVEEIAGQVAQTSHDIEVLRSAMSDACDSARQASENAMKRANETAAAIEALTAELAATDDGAPRRPRSTGAAGDLVTDC